MEKSVQGTTWIVTHQNGRGEWIISQHFGEIRVLTQHAHHGNFFLELNAIVFAMTLVHSFDYDGSRMVRVDQLSIQKFSNIDLALTTPLQLIQTTIIRGFTLHISRNSKH
jgi:hypothetical protein